MVNFFGGGVTFLIGLDSPFSKVTFLGIIIPVAKDTKKCYSAHRQWEFPYTVVLCGNFTIWI